LQLTAFGARDRCFFEGTLCRAPRRQLKRSTLGAFHAKANHIFPNVARAQLLNTMKACNLLPSIHVSIL